MVCEIRLDAASIIFEYRNCYYSDYLQNMVHYVKKYNFQAFRAWIGPSLYVVITDPKDVEVSKT